MPKILKCYVIPIISVVLSIMLWVTTSTDAFDTFLKGVVVEEKIESVKSAIDILNFCVLVIPLGIQSVIYAKGNTRCKEVISNFAQSQRELVSNTLKGQGFIDGSVDDINIRIFTKRFNKLVLEDDMKFCAREIKGKLSFSIPKNEGLCTKAYKSKKSMLEVEDGSRKEYNLSSRQKALAGQLKFIVAVPIVAENEKTVKRVICFDSFQKIGKDGCEEGILKTCENIAYHLNKVLG